MPEQFWANSNTLKNAESNLPIPNKIPIQALRFVLVTIKKQTDIKSVNITPLLQKKSLTLETIKYSKLFLRQLIKIITKNSTETHKHKCKRVTCSIFDFSNKSGIIALMISITITNHTSYVTTPNLRCYFLLSKHHILFTTHSQNKWTFFSTKVSLTLKSRQLQ